jgi:hypothetical protein
MSPHLKPSPHTHIIPIPRTHIITNIDMVRSVDKAKLKKLVGVFKKVPHLLEPSRMGTYVKYYYLEFHVSRALVQQR